jgi:hypothetical protein
MADDQFLVAVFQGLLQLGGILVGAFGFLYGVYAMYLSQADERDEELPAVVENIRRILAFLARLIVGATVVALAAFLPLWPGSRWGSLVALGVVLCTCGMLFIASRLAALSRP